MSPEQEAELRAAVEAGEALQGRLAGLEEQMAYLNALAQEFSRARAALEALKDVKRGEEVLLPLGGGHFVRASLAEEDRVLSGIGAGYSLEGSLAEALRHVEGQLEAAKQAAERLQEEEQRILAQMQALEQRVGQLTG